jgi:uncharacterized protein (DUF952 family)
MIDARTHWILERQLARLLQVREADQQYEVRYELVLMALATAARLGYQAGIRIDPAEPQWPVVYIELPTGQVSWHMPQHPRTRDGHTAEQKYDRVHFYAMRILEPR